MSLSGKLGFVPLNEILRLLTRSKQQGSVEVTGNGLLGRVFVGKGGIDLATTWADEDLHRHLVNSGFEDESALRRVTSGETTLAAISDSNQAMVDLVREVTVESLYQISSRGEEFQVREGTTSPYASPKSFELESLLEDAAAREKEWDKVSEIVPDLTGSISFRRDLGEREEVTVRVDDWKVLSEIGMGSSVVNIAEHLGTTQFWTARVTARLLKNDLVVFGTGQKETVKTTEDSWAETPVVEEDDRVEDPEEVVTAVEAVDEYPAESEYEPASEDDYSSVDEAPAETYESPAPVATEEEDADPDQSWWQEPKDDDGSSEHEDNGERTPEVVSEGLSEMPATDSDDDDDVEEDTEAFLEKVFSELETPEPEAEEGHGLLRRRRMGSLRDFSSDS